MINRWKDEDFCNKEALLTLARGFVVTALVRYLSEDLTSKTVPKSLLNTIKIGYEIVSAAEEGQYAVAAITKHLAKSEK